MDDLISRQAAIDEFRKSLCALEIESGREYGISFNGVERILKSLPSAERKGKWITYYHGGTDLSYSCNQCGAQAPFIWMSDIQKKSNYCYNCGARMERGEE